MSNPFEQLSDEQLAGLGARLRGLALRLVADESAADDLTQEAWVVLQRRGDLGVRELGPFLAGVLRKLSLRRSRREAAHRRREEEVARREAVPSPRELDEALHVQQTLVEELRALPDELREVLLLRYYEDLSCAEIARRRGLPASTVRSRLSRGLGELRERLDRRHAGGRRAWALALLRIRGREGFGPGIGSTSLGVLSMSAFTKSAVVVGLAIAAFVFWPERDAPSLSEAAEQSEVAREAEENGTGDAVLPVGADGAADRRAIASLAESVGEERIPRDRVLVRDRESEVAAHHYGVLVVGDRGRERLVETDEAGQLQLEEEHEARRVTLTAVDHESLKLRSAARLRLGPETWDEGALAHVFEVELGPSYELLLPAVLPEGDLYAFLYPARFDTFEGQPLARGAVVREGPLPWVRLAPFGAPLPDLEERPWYLVLHDRVGYWQAWAEVDSVVGEHERALSFESLFFGRAELRVRVDGVPPSGEVFLRVEARHPEAAKAGDTRMRRRSLFLRKGEGPEPGLASVNFLLEGGYRVSLDGMGYKRLRLPFDVRRGETTRVDLELEPTEGGHDLAVVLTSESGTIDFSRAVLYAHPTTEDSRRQRHARVDLESPPGEARYHFENLEPGDWRIEVDTIGIFPEFDFDSGRIVSADEGEVRFTCLDGRGGKMIALRAKVVDEETGADLEKAAITLWVEGELFHGIGCASGPVQLPSLAVGASIGIVVHAPGYRPLVVEEGPYPPALPGEDIREFRLERGWGTVILARCLDGGMEALPGVRVLVDGLEVGITDSNGRLVLRADEEPGSARFEIDGYRCLNGDNDEQGAKLLSTAFPGPATVYFQAK